MGRRRQIRQIVNTPHISVLWRPGSVWYVDTDKRGSWWYGQQCDLPGRIVHVWLCGLEVIILL